MLPYVFTAAAILLTYSVLSFFKDDIDLNYWLVASLYGCGSTNHSSLFLAHVPVIGAIWILLALFWCKTLFNIIHILSGHWLLASVMVSVLAILVDTRLINLPFAVLPGAGALTSMPSGTTSSQRAAFGISILLSGSFLSLFGSSPFPFPTCLWSAATIMTFSFVS